MKLRPVGICWLKCNGIRCALTKMLHSCPWSTEVVEGRGVRPGFMETFHTQELCEGLGASMWGPLGERTPRVLGALGWCWTVGADRWTLLQAQPRPTQLWGQWLSVSEVSPNYPWRLSSPQQHSSIYMCGAVLDSDQRLGRPQLSSLAFLIFSGVFGRRPIPLWTK